MKKDKKKKKKIRDATIPFLKVKITMSETGDIEIEPRFNGEALSRLSKRLSEVSPDDYDPDWSPNFTLAYALYNAFGEIVDELMEREGIEPKMDELNNPNIPFLTDEPIREIYDIATPKNQ